MSLNKKQQLAFDTAARGTGSVKRDPLIGALRELGAEVDNSTLVVKFEGTALGRLPGPKTIKIDYNNPAHRIVKAVQRGLAAQPA